jgi:hypothetical protein
MEVWKFVGEIEKEEKGGTEEQATTCKNGD